MMKQLGKKFTAVLLAAMMVLSLAVMASAATTQTAGTYSVTAQADGPLYCYFPTDRFKPAHMYVNGEAFGRMFDTYTQGITYLGMYKAGDTVTVRIGGSAVSRCFTPRTLPCCKAPVTPCSPALPDWKRCRPLISEAASPHRRTAR